MRHFKKRGMTLMLLGCCTVAVALLTVHRAGAVVSERGGNVNHVCLGDMDFNLGLPEAARSVWVGEADQWRLRGCTYPIHDFETLLGGKRYLVAGSDNGQGALVAYLNQSSPQQALSKAVESLESGGYRHISADGVLTSLNFALVYGRHEQLQLISVPYFQDQSLLIIVRTTDVRNGRGNNE